MIPVLTGRLSTNSSIPEGVVLDPQEKQNWNKTTADRDTWAHQERRRLSGWSNTDVATFKHREGRRGSVFSMWAPGKDKDGNDILMHDDHNDRADARSESGRSDGGAASYGQTLMPGSPKENAIRRASNNSDRPDRRGSVLSLWKGGKDAKGNDILGGDDEEWTR